MKKGAIKEIKETEKVRVPVKISSNVLEIDDISRLREKEGYDAPPVKVEPYDRPSASKSRSSSCSGFRFGMVRWRLALVVIAILAFISFMIYAFYPRSYNSGGVSVDELHSRLGRASRFSIEPNQFYEYSNGALSYYANLKRADSASSTSILSQNLARTEQAGGMLDCLARRARF